MIETEELPDTVRRIDVWVLVALLLAVVGFALLGDDACLEPGGR